MAGTSLLALIDDIAGILDDVAVLSKVAAKKTAGVLGDDLALNAEQVSGVNAERELPVVWAVAKGSVVNKIILLPTALVISAFAPFMVKILLTIGGLYLCFEGAEKVLEKFFPHAESEDSDSDSDTNANANANANTNAGAAKRATPKTEAEKIKGAIRTDFVLSAEIIVISLGSMSEAPMLQQIVSLSTVAALMTVGVYGLVAMIVKMDDVGLFLLKRSKQAFAFQTLSQFGKFLLSSAPYLMKSLGVLGTIAMFLVGGGLIVHSLEIIHHQIENLHPISKAISEGVVGFVAGCAVVFIVSLAAKLKSKRV